MKVALFRGCLITSRFPDYEISATCLLAALQIASEFVPEFSCCGSQLVESVDADFLLRINARNLACAQAHNVDTVVTLCGSCTYELEKTRIALRNPATRKEVNELLREEGLEYREDPHFQVTHLINFLHRPQVFSWLAHAIQTQIPARVALQLPCMAFRPPGVYADSDVSEEDFREILHPLGIHVIEYLYERSCCGGTMLAFEEAVGKKLALLRYAALKQSEVDFVVTACPNCHMVYGIFPDLVPTAEGHSSQPVPPAIFFTQLLGLGFGYSLQDLGLQTHRDGDRIRQVLARWLPCVQMTKSP